MSTQSAPLIAVLGAGPSQMPLILLARASGLRVTAIDGSTNRVGHLFSCGVPAIADLIDKAAVLRLCRERGVHGVVSLGSELGLQAQAYASAELGLPNAVPGRALALSGNKLLQKEVFSALGIEHPSFRRIEDTADVKNLLDQLTSEALVVKPSDMWGFLGITMLDSRRSGTRLRGEFASAVARAQAASPTQAVLAEEFIRGADISVDVRVDNGVIGTMAVVQKMRHHFGERHFGLFPIAIKDWLGHAGTYQPWRRVLRLYLAAIVSSVAPSWSGIVNADAIVTESGVSLLEVSFRGGGNGISLLGDAFLGTTHLVDVIQDALSAPNSCAPVAQSRIDAGRPIAVMGATDAVGHMLADPPVVSGAAVTWDEVFLGGVGAACRAMGRVGSVGGTLAIGRVDSSAPFQEVMNDLGQWRRRQKPTQ